MPRRPSAPLFASLCLIGLLGCLPSGCGLFGEEEHVTFREYALRGTNYEEAVDVIQTVTKRLFVELFGGGFSFDWDASSGNLQVSEILRENRRMTLYVKVSPRGDDTIVEMLAHVESLLAASDGTPEWGQSQQDVPLEEKLYRAYLNELVERRSGS